MLGSKHLVELVTGRDKNNLLSQVQDTIEADLDEVSLCDVEPLNAQAQQTIVASNNTYGG